MKKLKKEMVTTKTSDRTGASGGGDRARGDRPGETCRGGHRCASPMKTSPGSMEKTKGESATGEASEWTCTPGEAGFADGAKDPKEHLGDTKYELGEMRPFGEDDYKLGALILDVFEDRVKQHIQQALDGVHGTYIDDVLVTLDGGCAGGGASAAAGPCLG